MSPATKTSYSAFGGGGYGYPNVGGWNTTLTDVSTDAQECVGVLRTEGANTYMYVGIGTHTVTAQNWLTYATALTIGSYIPPIILTSWPAAGTANPKLCKAHAPQALSANTYAWVLLRGITTVQCQTDTTTIPALSIIGPGTDSHAKVKIYTTTGMGYMLTAIACDVSGPAYINLMPNW